MARAAAKRNKRPRQAARPQPVAGSASRSRDKALEDQLFFGRLRSHAKWAFVFLAVIFAGGFVFLGVGTGSGSGLGDVFSNIFTGGGGPSINKLQDKVAKNPKDAAALLALGQALNGKQRTDEAIIAYERYLGLRPKNVEALQQLGFLYKVKAQQLYDVAATAASEVQAADPAATFNPSSTSPFGKALGGNDNSVGSAVSAEANQRFQSAVGQYQTTLQQVINVYQEIAKLTPNESGALIDVAQAANLAGQSQIELETYKSFLKKFPDDPLAPDVRRQIKQLQKSLASTDASGQSKTG